MTRGSRPGCTGSPPTAPPPTSAAAAAIATSRSTPTVEPADRPPPPTRSTGPWPATCGSPLEPAIAELPPKLRAVVVLRDVYDLPHEAIAAELGITETAAKVRLHRARRALKARCFPDRREVAPPPGGRPCGVSGSASSCPGSSTNRRSAAGSSGPTSGRACAARPSWPSTGGLRRTARSLEPSRVGRPRPTCSTPILAGIERAGDRTAARTRRVAVYLGGVAATAAAAGGRRLRSSPAAPGLAPAESAATLPIRTRLRAPEGQ